MHQCSIGFFFFFFFLWSVWSWFKTGKVWSGRPGNRRLWHNTLLVNWLLLVTPGLAHDLLHTVHNAPGLNNLYCWSIFFDLQNEELWEGKQRKLNALWEVLGQILERFGPNFGSFLRGHSPEKLVRLCLVVKTPFSHLPAVL